ncbi:hypothetical protein IGI37_001996 [Enterococcus sp. AZ194]|uniref:tyrosine-type recombinase/integrase n=1 Tax=Enterococcus sp. AZ194 TaxID=2774629 RepID=UPI003F267CAA
MASYKKLKTGWQYRISYKNEAGKYATKSENGFKTQSAAKAVAEPLELMLRSGRHNMDAAKIPFVDYFWRWFELYKKNSVSEKTATHYKQTKAHISDFFGKVPIGDINEDNYQSFINNFGQTHAKETTSKLNTHCRSCFKRAVRKGALQFDPSENVIVIGNVLPKAEQTKFLNETEYFAFIREILNGIKKYDASRHLIILSLASGVRFSEAAGLTWDNINFVNNTIRIDKTWDFSNQQFAPTKNESSTRTITLDDITLKHLKEYRKNQLQHKQLNNKNNLVFVTLDGTPPTNNSVNKAIKRALVRAGISTIITHHGLRHTHVSILIHKRVNIKYISRRVGHQNVTTTYDKYSHVIDEMEQIESSLVSDIMISAYSNAK